MQKNHVLLNRVSHVRHGWLHKPRRRPSEDMSSNVLAISGPPGSGKSTLAALLLEGYEDRYVFAENEKVRRPNELEISGKIPYKHISLQELADLASGPEPVLWSINVDIYRDDYARWLHLVDKLMLEKSGVIIPEPEEEVSCLGDFTNCYRINRTRQQQRNALANGQVLVLEISYDLEDVFGAVFPGMVVVRPHCKTVTRVNRLMERYHPKSREEQVVASMKIRESLSCPQETRGESMVHRFMRNETLADAKEAAYLINRMYGTPTLCGTRKR